VHLDDVAALDVSVLEDAHTTIRALQPRDRVFHVMSGSSERVADIAAAACRAAGGPGVRHQPVSEARATMGAMADALCMDQVIRAQRSERVLGFRPRVPGFIPYAARRVPRVRLRVRRPTLRLIFLLSILGLAWLLGILFALLDWASRQTLVETSSTVRAERTQRIADRVVADVDKKVGSLMRLEGLLRAGAVGVDDTLGVEAILFAEVAGESEVSEAAFTHSAGRWQVSVYRTFDGQLPPRLITRFTHVDREGRSGALRWSGRRRRRSMTPPPTTRSPPPSTTRTTSSPATCTGSSMTWRCPHASAARS
jgi:hypothetical protein